MNPAEKPSCFEIFQDPSLRGSALQDAIHSFYPDGYCECQKVSDHSPGRVDDKETLTRLIIHPIHIVDSTGEIHPMAFADAYSIDLSVFREDLACDEEIQCAINAIRQTGTLKIPPQDRVVCMVAQAKSEEIRSLKFDASGERMFFIYDTGTPEKPCHASIFTPSIARNAGSNSKTGKVQREIRRKLHDLFNNGRVDTENYRQLCFEGQSLAQS